MINACNDKNLQIVIKQFCDEWTITKNVDKKLFNFFKDQENF